MDVIEIVDWDLHFENNRTRDMKSMLWVPVPNKMDGDGYTELMDHKNGPAHYCAWLAMVLIASRCRPRGTLLRQSRTLLRDGRTLLRSAPQAHDSSSLSRISRVSASVFEEAIPRLEKIGWIRRKPLPALESQEGAEIPHLPAAIPHPTDYGMEGNGRERNTPLIPPKKKRMKRPTVSEVAEYIAERGYHFSPDAFVAHYESNGWRVGKATMKSWHSACVTWEQTWLKDNPQKPKNRLPTPEEDALWTPT